MTSLASGAAWVILSMIDNSTLNLIPEDDTQRLQELRSYHILYTSAEEAFDNIAQIIAQVFDTPMAFISLVDECTVFYKSQAGSFGRNQVDRADILCSLTILTDEPTVFDDTRTKPFLATKPLVQAQGGIRFYAGAPLITAKGYRIGSVCVMDTKPRTFSLADIQLLKRFARQVMHEMDVRLAAQESVQTQQALLISEQLLRASETRLTDEELIKANQLLIRSNESLQQFACVASHDLQEPLRKIQSFGDIIKDQYAAGLGGGIDYLERMQAAAHRMSVLIKDLLTFSQVAIQSQATTLISLNQVIKSALINLDLLIQETGATVEVESLPTVSGERSQLDQLFENLLSNALKYRRANTVPSIRVSTRTVAIVDLPPSVKPAHLAPAYHCIDIVDNGIDFDEKYVDRIFEVFQRLHGKNQYSGTGIGLAICDKVAVNHGGAITARSQPGQGATFSVFLPLNT